LYALFAEYTMLSSILVLSTTTCYSRGSIAETEADQRPPQQDMKTPERDNRYAGSINQKKDKDVQVIPKTRETFAGV
jgi:hypothetical protein